MRKIKKSLSILLSLAIIVSSIFVGGLNVLAVTDLASTVNTYDDANVEFVYAGTDVYDAQGCTYLSVNGQPQLQSGNAKYRYLSIWNANVQDPADSGIVGDGKALRFQKASGFTDSWLSRASIYNNNDYSRFYATKGTTYKITLKYYVSKAPTQTVALSVRNGGPYEVVYGNYVWDAANYTSDVWCDAVFSTNQVTNGWVEATAYFTAKNDAYPHLVLSGIRGGKSASNVEVWIDDVSISECATVTVYNYNGTGSKTVYASEDTTLAQLEVPERAGYILTGMYSDITLTNKLDTSDLALNYTDSGIYYGWASLKPFEYYCGFEKYTAANVAECYNPETTAIVSGNTYAGVYNIRLNAPANELTAFELRDKAGFETVAGTKYTISFQYRSTADAKLYAGTAQASKVPDTATALSGADLPAAAGWTAASINVTLDKGMKAGFVPALMVKSASAATVEFDHIYITYPFEETESISDKFITSDSWYPSLALFEGEEVVESSSVWDGTTLTAPADSDSDGVYEITSGEELAYVVKLGGEGKNYILTKDIYVNDISKANWLTGEVAEGHKMTNWFQTWTADNSYVDFTGSIDGNFHTVYGLYYKIDKDNRVLANNGCGLIPRIAENSNVTIENLVVDNAFIDHEATASAFVACSPAGANLTIENCYAGKDVYLISCSTGVFRGFAKQTGKFTLKNCYSFATAESEYQKDSTDGNFNGLIGEMWEGTNSITISSCFNANGCISNYTYAEDYSAAQNCYQTVEGGNYTAGITTISADNMKGEDALTNANKMIGLNAFGNNYTATESYPVLTASKGLEIVEIWDGTISEPTKTDASGNVLISNGKELAYIISTGGVAGTTYKLTNNIYLNRIDFINWKTGATPTGYTPTPWYEGKSFVGNIDGDGYTVYGIYHNDGLETSAMREGFYNPVGLIPLVPNGATVHIKNLGVDCMFINAQYTASPFIGAAGTNSTSEDQMPVITIDQCYVGEKVDVTAFSAGVFRGYSYRSSIAINNCYSLGTIRSGIESRSFDPEISWVVANGWSNQHTANNFYNATGAIYGGHWTTNNPLFQRNYAAGYYSDGAPWYATQVSAANMQGTDALTRMPNLNKDADGNATDLFMATEGYPILKIFNGKMKDTIDLPQQETGGNNSGSTGTPTVSIWNGSTATAPTVGDGTEANPWQISSGAHLWYVIKNGGGAGVYYQLQNDIYLNDISKVNWLTGSISYGYSIRYWDLRNSAIQGHFDGNGHAVYGLYTTDKKTTYSKSPESTMGHGCGLFNNVPAGATLTVKNLGIDNSFVRFDAAASAFVGYVTDGATVTLENCYTGKNVSVDGGVAGGMVGTVGGKTAMSTVTVSNCYSLAFIYSEYDREALVGYTHWTYEPIVTITNSYILGGRVVGEKRTGTTATNCYESVDGPLNEGVTTIAAENMVGNDVLISSSKMAGLRMAGCYVAKKADFATANSDNYVYLPAGTQLSEDLSPLFFDNRMAPLTYSSVVSHNRMLRGAYAKFTVKPNVSKIQVPKSKAHQVAYGTASYLLENAYYDIETTLVSESLSEQSGHTVNYLFVTDPHCDTGDDVARTSAINQIALAVELANRLDSVDFVCLGGDLTNGGYATSEAWSAAIDNYLSAIKNCNKPVFVAPGNHDDNAYGAVDATTSLETFTNKLMNPDKWQTAIIDKFVNRTLPDGTEIKVVQNVDHFDNSKVNSKYYYYDLKDKNTRVITLFASDYDYTYDENGNFQLIVKNENASSVRNGTINGYNFWGYSNYQMKWLAEKALGELPEDYNVIILSHMAIYTDGTATYTNGPVLGNILKAYQQKTTYVNNELNINADYTKETGRILSYQHGHTHSLSENYDSNIGMWIFSTVGSMVNSSGINGRVMNEKAAAVDVMSVSEGSVYKKAVGYGNTKLFINDFPVQEGDINVDGSVDISDIVKYYRIVEAGMPAMPVQITTMEKIRRKLIGR